jgi:hypothetical protein
MLGAIAHPHLCSSLHQLHNLFLSTTQHSNEPNITEDKLQSWHNLNVGDRGQWQWVWVDSLLFTFGINIWTFRTCDQKAKGKSVKFIHASWAVLHFEPMA